MGGPPPAYGGRASMHGGQRPISPQVLTKLSRPPSLCRQCTPAVFLGSINTCCNRNDPPYRGSPPPTQQINIRNINQLSWATNYHFAFLLLPTGSPLMKLRQVCPLWPPPDHTECNLTEKSSPQPSILIFRKSKKKLATFPINFFRGIAKV